MKRIRESIRTRLITSFTGVILITAFITTVVGVRMIYNRVYDQAEVQVSSDLAAAKGIYGHYLDGLENSLRIHAGREVFSAFPLGGKNEELARAMEGVLITEKLDMLTLTDGSGKVLYRARNPEVYGDDQSNDPLIEKVIEGKEPVSSTIIVPGEDLQKESERLAERAAMEITPTPRSRPSEKSRIASGMVLKTAVPVFDSEGILKGVLYGGILLNRNYEMVDRIKKTVFQEAKYGGKALGTATIFQNDVRVSTNVMNSEGERAVTTRVSAEVAENVLKKGETWLGRAFVVNDWYISSYSPIKNIHGRIIGMLYVGVLEKPYKDILWRSLIIFLSIAFLSVLLGGAAGISVAQRISRPIREMTMAAQKIGRGDYSHKINITGHDEIGYLAARFNRMTQELARAHQELKDWAENLEQKVEDRTAEVKAMQAQLIQSEKLAGIGKLAAGVAHEINNPLTGVLTNSSLLLEDMPEDDPSREDLQTIVDATLRCRKIVKGLLDFARQTTPRKHAVDLNKVVEDALALVKNQAKFSNIDFKKDLDPEQPSVMADIDQIRQVVLNIVVNAAEAMPEGGELIITSDINRETGNVELYFSDTGPGIPGEIRDKLFEPFFSTKDTGTGLGLSIAYGIIQQHGGTIKVVQTSEKGTTIAIILPQNNGGGDD